MKDTLSGHLPGFTIEYHEQIGSTNTRAKELGAAGGAHMTLILTGDQTAGRGRMTRTWVTPVGNNIAMTLLLRPKLPAYRAPELVFLSAVALCDAVNALLGRDAAAIKWPNDLVIGAKKVSGTLLEMTLDGSDIDYAVIGIGVNVYGTDFPADLPYAGSIESETGEQLPRMEIIREFLTRFTPIYDSWLTGGFAPVLDLCRTRSATLGKPVRVLAPDGEYRGTAVDFDATGALVIDLTDGTRRVFNCGDVSVRGIMDYI